MLHRMADHRGGTSGDQFMDPVAIRLSARNAWLHFRRPMQLHLPPLAPLPKLPVPWPPLAPLGTVNRDPHRDYTLYTDTCYLLLVRFYDLGNLSGIMAVAAVFLGAGHRPTLRVYGPKLFGTPGPSALDGCCCCLLHSLIHSMVGGFAEPGVLPTSGGGEYEIRGFVPNFCGAMTT